MTFGFKIFRADGDIILSSEFQNYVLHSKTTSATVDGIQSMAPPLVFTTKLTSSLCANVPIASPTVSKNPDGTWRVSVGYFNQSPDEWAWLSNVGTLNASEYYIFHIPTVSPTGYGLAFTGDSGGMFSLQEASLIINHRVNLDPNGANHIQSGQSRTATLPSPQRSWAGLITSSATTTAGGRLFDSGTAFYYRDGHTIGGLVASFHFPSSNVVASFGSGFSNNSTQMNGLWPVWLIDTVYYQ